MPGKRANYDGSKAEKAGAAMPECAGRQRRLSAARARRPSGLMTFDASQCALLYARHSLFEIGLVDDVVAFED
jgi:hypothetical protein